MSPDLPPLTCPRCGMVNQVQKVSALVAAGTVHSSVSVNQSGGGYATYSGGQFGTITTYGHTQQVSSHSTQLSQRLLPPLEPPLPPTPVSVWTGKIVAPLVLLIVLGGGCGAMAFLMGIVSNEAVGGFLGGMPFALTCVGGIVALGLYKTTAERRAREAWQANYARWQAEHARWQAATARWDALYYCRRDDVVFFPGSPDAIPVESMWSIL